MDKFHVKQETIKHSQPSKANPRKEPSHPIPVINLSSSDFDSYSSSSSSSSDEDDDVVPVIETQPAANVNGISIGGGGGSVSSFGWLEILKELLVVIGIYLPLYSVARGCPGVMELLLGVLSISAWDRLDMHLMHYDDEMAVPKALLLLLVDEGLFSKPEWSTIHYNQLNAIACHTSLGDGTIFNHPRAAHDLLGYQPDSTSF
ncbi:hypothetical protein LguiB_020714 [Lonicera macranthoides]